jgi:hypothetical protein
MKAFKSKAFDTPIPVVKTSSKIKKLKRMLKEKREERGLSVISGTKSLRRDDDTVEAELVTTTKRYDPQMFDPKSLLHNELMEVVGLLEIARETYKDLPDGENAGSLSMLLREMRGFIGDLYQITQEDKDTIFKKLNAEVLEPFMMNVVKGVVSELDSARKQVVMTVGEDKNAEVTAAMKAAGRNIAPLLTTHYKELVKEVAKALCVGDVSDIMDRLNGINFAKKE